MPDLTIGFMRPTDQVSVLEKAARVLGVTLPPPTTLTQHTIEAIREVMHRHSFNRRMRDGGPEWFSFRVGADGKAVDIEVHRNRTQARRNADRLNLLEMFRVMRASGVGFDALIACASHTEYKARPSAG